jgi:signal transduction histidine kinase/CheY-like chemotaxis protein
MESGARRRAVEASGLGDWTRIIEARRQDRRSILPMSLVAAAGAWVWLGATFALAWLGGVAFAIALSFLLFRTIEARAATGRGWEIVLAAASLFNTGLYCALPVALMLHGRPDSQTAGLVMVGAMALSAGDEMVLSRPIGLSSLLLILAAAMGAVIWRSEPGQWLQSLLALSSMLGFFLYVLQASRRRRELETRMAAALGAAMEKEREAAIANAAKSTFLATISHEIRTPMNGVLGMAQAMAYDELTSAQRERLQVIQRSGEALTEILNDVLDLSKIEAGQLDIETVPFDLAEVLQAGVAAFAPRAAEKGLTLSLDLSDGVAGRYLGDPNRLRQVVYNLVSNALKFTAAGGVTVTARAAGAGVMIAVEDTGPGISEEDRARLFRKFEQLDASTTRRHGGTGLGLAICRELCELMGGEIEVRSILGQGSSFVVRLPLAPLAGGEAAIDAAVAAGQGAGRIAGLRVLAAEDNAVNRLVLATLLNQVGIEPTLVEDGAQAVAAWEAGDWDIVLMDVHMPVMDGTEAVRQIRLREAAAGRARTPVVALTANAMTHQVEALTEAGMDGHVSKPIDVARLFDVMDLALSGGPSA